MVPVPDADLPVVLPANPKLTGEGQSPLATDPEFVNVKCPKCGGPRGERPTRWIRLWIRRGISTGIAIRTMTGRRYDSAKVGYWFPIDQYIGGITHAILHLLYSRFWCKVMRDIGLIQAQRAGGAVVYAGNGVEGRGSHVQVARECGGRD